MSTQDQTATLPDSGERPLVVLVDAPSTVERRMIDRWLADARQGRNGRGLEVLPAEGEQLASRLTRGDNPLLVPVRVVWTPDPEPDRTLLRLADVLTRGWALRSRARAARRGPHPHRVVVGRPATVRELLRRHRRERAQPDSADFVRFVARQATLALDRAERALTGNRFKVPREVAGQIVGSAHFSREIQRLAATTGRPEDEVATEAAADLESIVASLDPSAVDLFSGVLRPMHQKAWTVHADTAGLEPLRELNANHALVFLPSHRSYTDPFVLADVLRSNDFPRNHVLGGDNLRIIGLEQLARRSGIIFIRRSFGGDPVYKAVVREYFSWLCAKRFNLEWYMEGGRTRTGKLRPPKYGLLSDVASAVETRRTEDVYLVPVSIIHDQLQEVHQMAAEQTGAAKTPEGLRWLMGYARAQRRPVGGVHVSFGEPLSLRSALTTAHDPALDARPSEDPHSAVDDSPARRLALQKTAFEVFVRINRVTPVTPIALAALALLGVRDRALTLAQVRAVLDPLRAYVRDRDLPQSGGPLDTDGGVRRVLAALIASNVVTVFAGGEEPVYAIERGQHLVAAFYRNSAIHHVVDRALAELVLLSPPGQRWDTAYALRDQLKFEFFFPDRDGFRTRLAEELERLHPDWDRVDGPTVLRRAPFLVAHRVLRSFVDAQLVVAERLAARPPRRPLQDKEFLDECGGVGQQMLLQGRLHGPESLSRELFAGALRLAAQLDLVDPGREELGERRAAFAERLRDVVARVRRIDEIDAESRREAVGV